MSRIMHQQLKVEGADVVVAALEDLYPGIRVTADPDTPARVDVTTASGGGLTAIGITVAGFRGHAQLRSEETFQPVQTVTDGGVVELEDGTAGNDSPYQLHGNMSSTFTHVKSRSVDLNAERLQEFARGVAADSNLVLRTTAALPLTPELGVAWAHVADHIHRLFADTAAADSDLILGLTFDLAATQFLHSFASTLDFDRLVSQRSPASAAVRRGVAFIEAHVADPIGVIDIAAAARLSVRGVQLAFRRETGSTPLEYLRTVRLHAAREELLAADPTTGATVAGIARRWGFAQAGRFSLRYRDAFGESPGQTLRR